MTAVGSCACGATFSGRQNHCTLCHQTFATERGGDSHRVGPYDPPGARRCITPDMLSVHGMWQDPRGVWHGTRTKDPSQPRRRVVEATP